MANTTLLADTAIANALQALPGWHHSNGTLHKTYLLPDFAAAMALIVRVGIVSERLDHHAHLVNIYNRVELAIHTHTAGGVTELDIAWAHAIDDVSTRQAPQ